MSKHSEQMRKLMRSPKAMMEFQVTGKLPSVDRLDSPLIRFLESLGAQKRLGIRPARLHPALGYDTNLTFNNAEQMYRWLKPSEYVSTAIPAESYRIKHFSRQITSDIFMSYQQKK